MYSIKIIVVGNTRVGKSSILTRFVKGLFTQNLESTIGAAFLIKSILLDKQQITFHLWDTAGQEQYRSLAPMYYRSATNTLLVYDITSKMSLDDLEYWVSDIKEKAPHSMNFFVVGNKEDLNNNREVTQENAKSLSERLGAIYCSEISAKTGKGVNELFNCIAKNCLLKEPNMYQQEEEITIETQNSQNGASIIHCC